MRRRFEMPPPMFAQRLPFTPMWYWIHAYRCPLIYRATTARGYRWSP